MNGAVTGPLAARPSPRPRRPEEDRAVERTEERDDFWRAWEWSQPDDLPATGATGRTEGSDVAALLPDDLLDGDSGDRRWWGRRHRREARDRHPAAAPGGRRGRRALAAVGSLAVLSGGFLAGVVVDRAVSADALAAARAAGTDGTGAGFSGRVEADANGTLAVVGADGRRQTVRTSPGTEVVSMNLLSGDLPPGTPVQVRTRTATDGSLEATSVAVTGAPGADGGAVVSGP